VQGESVDPRLASKGRTRTWGTEPSTELRGTNLKTRRAREESRGERGEELLTAKIAKKSRKGRKEKRRGALLRRTAEGASTPPAKTGRVGDPGGRPHVDRCSSRERSVIASEYFSRAEVCAPHVSCRDLL